MATTAPTTSVEPKPAGTQRLMSVDALRGFDMFWIIGADSLVYALHRMAPSKPTTFLADQLEHAEWEGFHFYDLIFPLFVFLAGVSLVFSLSRTIEQAGRGEALKRVFRRGILLFVIGLIYSGGFTNRWPDMRLMGVLNRIALAYFFAGLLFCFCKPRALAAVAISFLIAYWALMTFVPIRDIQLTKDNLAALAEKAGDRPAAELLRESENPSRIKNSPAWAAAVKLFEATTNRVTGKFGKGYNVCDHFDFQYLPGKKYDTFFDPEGYLSTLPAVVTCLLGVFAGLLLRNPAVTDDRKVLYLMAFGVASAALGWLWGLQLGFPVVKKIWTSSYVLVAGGYSALLLGGFYWLVEIRQVRRWCQPFVWMGMNSITVYLASNFLGGLGFLKLASRLAGGDVKLFLDSHIGKGAGDLTLSLVGLALAFWFVHFLYRRKIFLRL